MPEKITNNDLEKVAKDVADAKRYGEEGKIIKAVLKKYPNNTDDAIIAMKIALIDMTNSTNLNKHLGNIELGAMVKKIRESNFDIRVKKGDLSLVSELSKWSKENGVNLFSFWSKYCLYHNVHCYERDDYSIYDSVVNQHLKKYNPKFTPYYLDKLRNAFDYKSFMECMNSVISENNLDVKNVRRKLDWFIWYNNRTRDTN